MVSMVFGVQDWFANPATPTRRYRASRFGSWTVVNLWTCRHWNPRHPAGTQWGQRLYGPQQSCTDTGFSTWESIWKQKEPWINLSNISKNMPCLQISITSSYLCIETCPHLTQLTWISQAARRLLEHWRSQRLTTGGKNEHQGWMPSWAICKQTYDTYVSKHVCIKQISYDIIFVYCLLYPDVWCFHYGERVDVVTLRVGHCFRSWGFVCEGLQVGAAPQMLGVYCNSPSKIGQFSISGTPRIHWKCFIW